MLIAGNWKMFKGPAETEEFCAAFEPAAGRGRRRLPALHVAARGGRRSGVDVFAQNVHWETRARSPARSRREMLLELGVEGALVGHSERRQYFGETDETTARRAERALDAGLGSSPAWARLEEEREAGRPRTCCGGRSSRAPSRHERLVVAYEPVWAIGTGKTATPEQAQEAHALHQEPARRSGPLRRLGEAGQRSGAPRRSPTSTARSWAAPRSRSSRSPRFARRASRIRS